MHTFRRLYIIYSFYIYKGTWGILFYFLFYRRFIRTCESEKCDFERNHAVKLQYSIYNLYTYIVVTRYPHPFLINIQYIYIYIYNI